MLRADVQAFLVRYSWVVVTGGSSGIGAEFLKAFGKLRGGPGLCNLSRSRPDGFTDSEHFRHFPCDLEEKTGPAEVAAELLAHFARREKCGPILLINNSGFGLYGEFPEGPSENIAAMVDLNCRAPVELTARLWPALMKHGGAVINVASLAGFQPTPFLATYAATKAFMLHWSIALDAEGRRHGVRALALCPGPTPTRFFRRAGFGEAPVPGYGTSAEFVVRTALIALARGDAKVVPGFPNKLIAFTSSLAPKRLSARIGHRILSKLRLKPLRDGTGKKPA